MEGVVSYCRFGKRSGVYLYPMLFDDGRSCCCACTLHGHRSLLLPSRLAAVAHLDEHRAAGHQVPEEAYRQLQEEMAREIPSPFRDAPSTASGQLSAVIPLQ